MKKNKHIPVLMTTALFVACLSLCGCEQRAGSTNSGSLDNQIDIGDIVVSTDAVQHDFTVEAIGFEKGEIPYTGLYAFPADEAMRKKAVQEVHETAPRVEAFEGRVCSGDQFISSKEQRDKIISDFGGMCCEMEGGAIAQVCYLNETPFVIIRAISDKADESEEMSYEELRKRLPGTAQPLSAIWSRIKKDAVQNTGETYYIGTEEEA